MNITKLFVCGDIINMFSKEQFIGETLQTYINTADYVIGNFEGTCEFPEIIGRDMVQMPQTLSLLKDVGFDMLLLGNNHVADYGEYGLANTLKSVKSHGFDYIGAGMNYDECYSPVIRIINGKKFGFLNLCEAQIGQFSDRNLKYGYAWIGDSHIETRIKEVREQVDFLILFVHAGLENYELPLPQFRALYRHYCDLGVDVVVGGHPHIAQGIENYESSLIFYSLGNFYFPRTKDLDDSQSWSCSYSIMLTFSEGGVSYLTIPHRTHNNKVDIDESSPINIQSLSQNLLSPNYDNLISQQNVMAFKNLPYRLIRQSLNGAEGDDSKIFKIKFIINYILRRKGFSTQAKQERLAILKRLFQNETYRYLTINAIEELQKNK